MSETEPTNRSPLAERLEGVGAQLGSGSLRDMAWLSVRSLVEKDTMDKALDTMTIMLAKPDFLKAPFERQKKLMLVGFDEMPRISSKRMKFG